MNSSYLKKCWEHEMSEELKRALSYVEWKNLKDENRIHMIRYFIAGELYNEALKGIEQYGYQFLDKQQLCTICLYALTTLSTRRSELLVANGTYSSIAVLPITTPAQNCWLRCVNMHSQGERKTVRSLHICKDISTEPRKRCWQYLKQETKVVCMTAFLWKVC